MVSNKKGSCVLIILLLTNVILVLMLNSQYINNYLYLFSLERKKQIHCYYLTEGLLLFGKIIAQENQQEKKEHEQVIFNSDWPNKKSFFKGKIIIKRVKDVAQIKAELFDKKKSTIMCRLKTYL